MLKLAFDRAPRSILFIGAHCDDIEIGCGGAVLTLVERIPAGTYRLGRIEFIARALQRKQKQRPSASCMAPDHSVCIYKTSETATFHMSADKSRIISNH